MGGRSSLGVTRSSKSLMRKSNGVRRLCISNTVVVVNIHCTSLEYSLFACGHPSKDDASCILLEAGCFHMLFTCLLRPNEIPRSPDTRFRIKLRSSKLRSHDVSSILDIRSEDFPRAGTRNGFLTALQT